MIPGVVTVLDRPLHVPSEMAQIFQLIFSFNMDLNCIVQLRIILIATLFDIAAVAYELIKYCPRNLIHLPDI